ncbi:site-specific integrase [Enterococcus avium]|nr:site-specific integrase [Enterococcus avium]
MIKKYQKKNGDTAYMFRIYLGIDPLTGKKQFTTRRGFKTKKEAKIALARLKIDVNDNKYTPEQNYTFTQIKDLWLRQYKDTVKESTYQRVKFLFDKNISKKFGNKRISKYTVPYCQNVINEWKDHFATHRALKSYTSTIFDFALKMNVLKDNPMSHVSFSKGKRGQIVEKEMFLESDDLKRFLECCENDSFPLTLPFFRLLAFTGLRKGEALALTWNDIDFKNNQITVDKTASINEKNKVVATSPKTPSSNRTISIDQRTVDVLKRWRKEQREYLLAYGHNSLKPNQLVFASKRNNFISLTRFNNVLYRICDDNNFSRLKIHGFRHTHCSLLFEAGLSVKEVQDRLGHSNVQTTLNIYTHVTKKQKDLVAEKFSNYVNF